MQNILAIVVVWLASYAGVSFAREHSDQQSALIRFEKDTKTSCAMYSDLECYVNILIKKNDLTITPDDISSSDTKTFTIPIEDSIKLCELKMDKNSEPLNNCSFEKFNWTLNENRDEFSIYTVKLNVRIVGFSYLVFFANKPNEIKYPITVTEPRRIIDIAFDWYIRCFQLMISLLMGILLDTEALKQLVKMPIPVLVTIRF